MNRYFLLFSIIFLVITGCHHKEEKSDAYGNFEADEVMVAAESNGKILYLSMAEGSSIEKGAVVGLVDTIDFYLQKLQLINSIESVKISKQSLASEIAILEQQRDNLRKEYHRLEKMFADGAATQKQIDEANGGLSLIDKQILAASSKYNSIDSEIEAYQISLRQAEVAISRCKIVAPVSGTVLSKYLHEGEFAAVGRPVFKVADLSNMYLRVYVSGDQLPHIKLGQSVDIMIDNTKSTNSKLSGIVSWISEEAIFTPKIIQTKKERVNMVYPVKITVKNNGEIKAGMPGEVNFI